MEHPTKSINEQLAEQVRTKNLRMRELMQELDGDGDGLVEKTEWTCWMQTIGPGLPASAFDAAFDEADVNKSGTIELKELENFFRPPKAHAKASSPSPGKKAAKSPSPPVKAPSRIDRTDEIAQSMRERKTKTKRRPSMTEVLGGAKMLADR